MFVSRADPEKLFADSNHGSSDGLISAYLAFEFYRVRAEDKFDLNGNIQEKLRILDWYLRVYHQHRKKILPLSAKQIAFLNKPLPVHDFAHPISVVSYSFIRRELGQQWNMADAKHCLEAIYWWCIERVPDLNLEDSLIPDYYVDLLRQIDPGQRWLPYHLNYFAFRFYAVSPSLHFLDISRVTDRLALLTLLLVKCAERPYLVRFLPPDAVGRLLRPSESHPGYITLDEVLATPCAAEFMNLTRFAARDVSDRPKTSQLSGRELQQALESGRELRQLLMQSIERGGYSLRSGRRLDNDSIIHAGECFGWDKASDAKPEAGVALIGPLTSASGLGQASRMSLQALLRTDHELSLRVFDMDNPAPQGYSTMSEMEYSDAVREINLIHLNAESIPLAFAYMNNSIYKNSYNIGYFFWELTKLPKCHRLALEMLDEIWVSSEYNREIYSRQTNIPVINVGMAVEETPIGLDVTRRYFGLPENAFIFLVTFDSFSYIERKNPLAAVQAFRDAFPPENTNVRLVLKTQNRTKVDTLNQKKVWTKILEHCSADQRIIVIDETLTYAELIAFKRLCDCYVSLHRSEGWGFGLIEAMQLGIPVVATAYSGNLEFCNEETCFLVDFDLIAPWQDEYIFVERGSQWAEPQIRSAVECLRRVEEQPSEARKKAKIAQKYVMKHFSASAVAQRYRQRLEAIQEIIAKPHYRTGVVDRVGVTEPSLQRPRLRAVR